MATKAQRECNRRYALTHKNEINARRRAKYASDPIYKEKRLASFKKTRENPESRDKMNAYQRKYIAEHPEYKARCKEYSKKRDPVNLHIAQKKHRQKLRLEVLNAYGGPRCVCCGEIHLEFLTIDHINGGGRKHEREVSGRGGSFYVWLKKNGFPPGFQVLCHNCNYGKYVHGKCPHQS